MIVLVTALALLGSACGGPDDATKAMSEACERQIEQAHEEEGGTPTAKSSTERLEQEQLVECAGQREDASDAHDAEGDDAPHGKEEAGADEAADDAKPAAAELDPAARQLFVDSCGSCHVLSDAGTTGTVGPNLDQTDMSADEVRTQIEEGGGAMPADLLQGEDADKVAEYVADAAAAE